MAAVSHTGQIQQQLMQESQGILDFYTPVWHSGTHALPVQLDE